MMKVFAFIFIATFCVVGIKCSGPEATTTEFSTSTDELTTVKTPGEDGETVSSEEPPRVSMFVRMALKLVFTQLGFLVNGKLDETKVDSVVEVFRGITTNGHTGSSELTRVQVVNCAREANLETEEYEVINRFFICGTIAQNDTTTVAPNVN